jgi:hypothetical protein
VRRLRGARDGTTCENADYWVLRSSAVDGTMEATIVDEWYNFIPIPTYKTMDIAEAEMLFEECVHFVFICHEYFTLTFQSSQNAQLACTESAIAKIND